MDPISEVHLARDRVATFPRRCIACGSTAVDGFVEVSTRGIWATGGNWIALLIGFFSGRIRSKVRVDAPACEQCRDALARARRVRTIVRWVVPALAGVAIVLLSRKYGNEELFLWSVLVPVVAILLLFERYRPLPLDITLADRAIEYEFADRAYAEEFARLNGARVED